MVAIAALVAVVAALAPEPAPRVAAAAHDDALRANPDAELFVVRLIKVGPRTARVMLDDADLGELTMDEAAGFTGWAIAKLMNHSRRISLGRVEIHPDAGLPEGLAPGVQRMLFRGGVLFSTLVPPPGAEFPPLVEESQSAEDSLAQPTQPPH